MRRLPLWIAFLVLFAAASAATAQESIGLGGGGATGGPTITSNGIMFVACDMFGTYRSTNSGKDWTLLDERQVVSADGSGIFSVAVDPANPRHVFAFHPLQGVKESFQQGANGTWKKYQVAATWTPGPAVTSMAISRESVPTVLLGTDKGVFKIQQGDSGHPPSWQLLGMLPQPVLKVLFVTDTARSNGQHAFVATSAGIYSLDESASQPAWTPVGPPSGWPGAVTDLVGGSDPGHYVLYAAAGSKSVYRYDSAPAASGWQKLAGSDRCFQPGLLGMAQNALDTVYATSVSGSCANQAVFRGVFQAGAMTWTSVYDAAKVTGGWLENAPGYGRGWGFGGPARGFAVHPADANVALLTNLGGVYVTLDGGKSWIQRYTNPANVPGRPTTTQTNGLDVTTTWNHYRRRSRTFIASSDIGLSVRDDDSQWTPINSDGVTNWNTFYELAIDDSGGRIWAAVSQEHDIPHDTELDDSAKRTRVGAVLVSVDTITERAGRTWGRMRAGPLNNPLPAGPVVSVLYQAPYLYASVWGVGVFRSLPDARGTGDWVKWGAPADAANKHFYQLHADDAQNVYVSVAAKKSTVRCTNASRSLSTYTTGALYQLGPSPSSNWELLTGSMPNLSPVDFTFDVSRPGVVYLATRDTRVGDPSTCKYSSWVGAKGVPTGGLWKLTRDGLDNPRSVQVLSIETPGCVGGGPVANPDHQQSLQAFSPVFVGRTLYLATVGHGVLRSFDFGATWSPAFPALPFLATQRVGVDRAGAISVTTFGGGAWLLFSPSW